MTTDDFMNGLLGGVAFVFFVFMAGTKCAESAVNTRWCDREFSHASTAADTMAIVRDTTLPKCKVSRDP